MILENENEKEAWKMVCELADQATDRICTDLEQKDVEKFKGLTTPCDDGGTIIQTPINQTYQVLYWLKAQVKIEMKTFSVRVSIEAENEEEAHKKISEMPDVVNYIDQSLEEIDDK